MRHGLAAKFCEQTKTNVMKKEEAFAALQTSSFDLQKYKNRGEKVMMNGNMNYEKGKNDNTRPRYANTRYEDRRNNLYERIPRDAIERCYVTEFLKEVNYLTEKGIRPVESLVKRNWGIRQYKYVKTPELFAALHEFWTKEFAEREFRRVDRDIERATHAPEWAKRVVQ